MAYNGRIATWMVAITAFNDALTGLQNAHEPAIAELTVQRGPDGFAQQLAGTSWNQLASIAAELERMRADLVACGWTLTE